MEPTHRYPPIRRYRKLLGVELTRSRLSSRSQSGMGVSAHDLDSPKLPAKLETPPLLNARLASQITTEIVEIAGTSFPEPRYTSPSTPMVSIPAPADLPLSERAVVGQILPSRGGVSAWTIGDTLHLFIAPFRTRAQCTDVLSALLEIYDAAPHTANWRIDLSELDLIPLMLVGALVAYKGNLARRARTLELVVSPQCFHSRYFSGELRRHFAVSIAEPSGPPSVAPVIRRATAQPV